MTNNSKREVWEEHSEVFHYTTQEGLEGILGTQSLRATHYRYLNDQSELAVLRPKLGERVRPYLLEFGKGLANRNRKFRSEVVERGLLEQFVDHEVATIINVLHSVTLGEGRERRYFDPYIVAFCSHDGGYEQAHGLLSQWRGYGGGGGYAIVFDTQKLSQAFGDEALQYAFSSAFFGDVVYDGDEKRFEQEFGDVPDLIWNRMQSIYFDQEPREELFERFLHAVSRYKHRGFKEEREVRAIFSPLSNGDLAVLTPQQLEKIKEKKIKEPQFKQGFVPFLQLLGAPGTKLPIKRIIVGPHADKELRKSRLDRYVEIAALEIEITVSETPLV